MIAPVQPQSDSPAAPGAVAAVTSSALPTSEIPPVDLPRLLEVSDDDPELLREMVELFLDESGALMQKLGVAVQAGAAKEVEQLAHQFKGASASCGMSAMLPSLQGLERMGKSGTLSEAAEAYGQAGECLERTKDFLNRYLQNLP